jgi:hypothetical protein
MKSLVRVVRLAFAAVLLAAFALALVGQPAGTTAQTDPIDWSKKNLKWDDFKGAAPNPLPVDGGVTLQAEISFAIATSWKCEEDGSLTFEVKAVMEPDNSWATAAGKKDQQLLKHEQGHFDLSEVFARKLRKALSDLPEPCDEEAVQAVIDKNDVDHQAEQKKYDDETKHGTDKKQQQAWEKSIADQLKAG